jgi:DNA mismatch repair protein MutL
MHIRSQVCARPKILKSKYQFDSLTKKMSKIQILPESLINKIAAGEVVERPASVVKELVENAIDAGSSQIFVTITNGGKDTISVLDNGQGMTAEDAGLAIERHATSKIRKSEDLESIMTMGFRGEALAAISAVSRFELTTCGNEETGGYQVRVEGGKIIHTARMGFPKGTRIVVENLFFNTPARQKFMKSANTEYSHIHDLIIRLALGNPAIQFRLTHNKNLVLNIPGGVDFKERVHHCFGSDLSEGLMECQHEETYLKFNGLISLPTKARSSRRWQHTFVNGRYVKCSTINHGIYEGYKTLLMKHTHPVFFINLQLSPGEIDVNVHPAKTEIRLKNANLVHTILAGQISLQLKQRERSIFVPEKTEDKLTTDLSQANGPLPNFEQTDQKSHQQSAESESVQKPVIYEETDNQLGFMSTAVGSKNLENAKPDESNLGKKAPIAFAGTTTLEEKHSDLEISDSSRGYTAIGQLSNKYLLVQGEDKLILVDQHAAHERIRFEEIRRQFFSKTLQTQALLVPVMIELPPQDGILLDQYKDSWEKLGFTIDHFGGNDYSVKEIPMILKDSDIAGIIKSVLDEIAQFGKSGKLDIFFDEVFEKMACHSAIRASQQLSREEMDALIAQLIQYDIMLHCPHGRPVWIEFSIDELDKRFKR